MDPNTEAASIRDLMRTYSEACGSGRAAAEIALRWAGVAKPPHLFDIIRQVQQSSAAGNHWADNFSWASHLIFVMCAAFLGI